MDFAVPRKLTVAGAALSMALLATSAVAEPWNGLLGGRVLTEAEKLLAAAVVVPDVLSPERLALRNETRQQMPAAEQAALYRKHSPKPLGQVVTATYTIFDTSGIDISTVPEAQPRDAYALVQTFDYPSGETRDSVVNVTRGRIVRSAPTIAIAAISPEETALASAIVLADDDVKRTYGERVADVDLNMRPLDPVPFGATRVLRVGVEIDGRNAGLVKYVDLKREAVVERKARAAKPQ